MQQGSGTKPISIKSSKKEHTKERAVAHSAPVTRWAPPNPPLQRPRVDKFTGPLLELPSSIEEPSFLTQTLALQAKNEQPNSVNVKRAAVARSLAMSSSMPVDFGQFLGQITPLSPSEESDENENKSSSVSSTSSTSPTSSSTILGPQKIGGKPIVLNLNLNTVQRKDSMMAEDKRFSVDALSKSPTVFGFMAVANKQTPPNSSRALHSHKRPSDKNPASKNNSMDMKQDEDQEDLQFAISLDNDGDDGYLQDDSPPF
jgi:hypothetical protein